MNQAPQQWWHQQAFVLVPALLAGLSADGIKDYLLPQQAEVVVRHDLALEKEVDMLREKLDDLNVEVLLMERVLEKLDPTYKPLLGKVER